jgi:hypothetical protein
MLNRFLTEHAAGCFYADEKLAERLWQTLSRYPQDNSSREFESSHWHLLQTDFYHLLVEGIDARHPREYRLSDIRQLIGTLCDGSLLLEPDLPWLDQLIAELLQRNGDLLCYRESRVQVYVRLAAELDPTLLVAWHLSDWLQHVPETAVHDIRRVVSAQTAFFAPPGNPFLPFAEGHVHFWGITADTAILDDYLFAGCELEPVSKANPWKREQYERLSPLLRRARILLVLLLGDSAQPRVLLEADRGQRQEQLKGQGKEPPRGWPHKLQWLNNPMMDWQQLPDWLTLAALHATANVSSADWVLGELAQAMARGCDNRWLWLQLYLCRRYQAVDTHPLERTAILCWWQTVNALRRTQIMDGQGLTRFAERYFSSALGRGDKSRHDNMRRLFAMPEDVAEIKSGPTTFSPTFSKRFSTALASLAGQPLPRAPYIFGEHEILPDARAKAYLETLERWHFCGHFSRSAKEQKWGIRAKPNSKELWKNAEKLLARLGQQASWNQPEFLGGKLNPHYHFNPARWFRGLDVAGDENALGIEWFAPMLRWLRSGFMARPDGERASTGFHLSIHAGEDYAHPASGMRHIDETVRFCEMRDGDRLGHALALGIEPALWAERQGEMLLPLDEHLDNLVWLWHYATLLSGRLPLAQQVLPSLERRIARFYRECDWWRVPKFCHEFDAKCREPDTRAESPLSLLASVTPDILYQAWLLRRNCHYRLQQLFDGMPFTVQEKTALPDWACISDTADVAGQLYLRRHSHLGSGKEPPLVIVRAGDEWLVKDGIGHEYHKQALRRNITGQKAKLLEDVETPAELEFMHALQDYLLDQYDSMGLIIESNPTSNVYIARLKEHSEHPIFRWYPPDEAVLAVGEEANRYGLRRGPVRVLVNTDDPGIMPTTLRTEFLLLREAALARGVGRTVAERWLDTLRRYGIEQFHRNHLPVFEPI